MRRSRPARAALPGLSGAAVLCLLLLAGCENPAGLPDGLGDPDGNDPNVRTVAADSVEAAAFDDLTGAFLTEEGFNDFQALAGRVDDPAFGTTTALGYVDFLPPSNFPEGFLERPLREVTLQLQRRYVYGDTLASTTFDLRQVLEEWDAVSAASDTLFPVQEATIVSFEVAASDSLVEISLPDSWIADNDTTLRSSQFSNLFHGFQLQAQDGGNAVYGFSGGSTLELVSAEDTVIYRASELFSNLDRTPPAAPPADGRLRIQDGTGESIQLKVEVDALGRADINTAFIRVDADSLADPAPMGFVRPQVRELVLYGLGLATDDNPNPEPVFLASAMLDEETQTFSFGSASLTGIVQDLVLDRSGLARFIIGFPAVPPRVTPRPFADQSSIDAVSLVGPGEDGAPRAVVILIPN
ncbi:MAG: hypothetical protein AAGI91_17805 [Bacteroidota bacterium]